jgi:preprotein translocase subunit SecY
MLYRSYTKKDTLITKKKGVAAGFVYSAILLGLIIILTVFYSRLNNVGTKKAALLYTKRLFIYN